MNHIYSQVIDYCFIKTIDIIIKNGAKVDKNSFISRLSRVKTIMSSINDKTIEEIMDLICYEYYLQIDEMINRQKLAPGFSGSIFLDNGLGITTYSGKTNTHSNAPEIDGITYFDIASITKFLTSSFIFDQHQNDKINIYQRIEEINADYPISKRLIDLLRFNYDIKTDSRIDKTDENGNFVCDKAAAIELLKNAKIVDECFTYSDIPYMIAGMIIPNFENEIMKYFKKIGMDNTLFNPLNVKTTGGQIGQQNIVHDPKSRVMEGISGHAGIFSTSADLTKLLNVLLNTNHKLIWEMIRIRDYKNKYSRNNRMGAVYRKHPLGLNESEVPHEAAYRSLATAGFTGGWALYDLGNKYTTNFLSNPLSNETGTKDQNFTRLTNPLKEEMVYTAFMLRIASNILSQYYSKEQINNVFTKKL